MQNTKSLRLSRCGGVLALVLFVGGPGPLLAATPTEKCAGAKAMAFGGAVAGHAQCQAKARAKGVAVEPGCLPLVEAKLQKRFAKAEKADTCPIDAAAAWAAAARCVTAFDPLFGPTAPELYWSATTTPANVDDAWFVYFGPGNWGNDGKRNANRVRAVR